MKDSLVHQGEKQFSHEGKNGSLRKDVQLDESCDASVDEKQNDNCSDSHLKKALPQNVTDCPDTVQTDLDGSSQLDQQPGTERELDGSAGTDVETNKEKLLPCPLSSARSCEKSPSCEEDTFTSCSEGVGGYAEKEFGGCLLESFLSDFESSGSSGLSLMDMSGSCIDSLIGKLDSPQPELCQQKREPEQSDEVTEDDRCPSTFCVSCITSSTVDYLPGNPVPALEHHTEGITEESGEKDCRSDQHGQMLSVTTADSLGDQNQLSPKIHFGLDKDKEEEQGLHNQSHVDGLSKNSDNGCLSQDHDNKLHDAIEKRDENLEEDLKSSSTLEEEFVDDIAHPRFDKEYEVEARQDVRNLRPTDMSLPTSDSDQILSKEHQQVLQMLSLGDKVDATADPDSDFIMSSLPQEDDSPAAAPVDKDAFGSDSCDEIRAQALPSGLDHCEQSIPLTLESDMDSRPSEHDVASMQDGFFLKPEDDKLLPHGSRESDRLVTSSSNSPHSSLEVLETPRQSACGAAEYDAIPKVDSVCHSQAEHMPCSIKSFITGDHDTWKPDIDVELSPFSSLGDFSMLELPAEITVGEKQVRAVSLISHQEALANSNADVHGREDQIPQKDFYGDNTHKSTDKFNIFEDSEFNPDAENGHWDASNCITFDSEPPSLTQSSSGYRPVAAPSRKVSGQAASCLSVGESGDQESQAQSGMQDQKRATDTTHCDLPQSSFVKDNLPDQLTQQSCPQSSEADLVIIGSSTPDMSEHSPDDSKGIQHSRDHHQPGRTHFTITQKTAENSHDSRVVPSISFGQNRLTPQSEQSQFSEMDHTGVQFPMQKESREVSISQDWSDVISADAHAEPCHTPRTAPQPSQESHAATQGQSCFALQGEFNYLM